MGEWKRVKIGDVCTIEKGVTGIVKALPGNYPLVTTGAERKTSIDYQFDTKAVCIPLVSSTGHGKKTLNYVHYQEGTFALGSILSAVVPRDETILDARYLHVYLQKNKDRVLVPLMKGAANVSLSVTAISNIEVPLPSLVEQKKILGKIDSISNEHEDFLNELDVQIDLFGKLRQAVLQEAIEGKLTVEWRTQNPELISGDNHASKLLEKIKAEKERLIKEGNTSTKLSTRIKKDASRAQSRGKPLAPIADAEKPFDLPDGWVWCRLGEIADGFQYGSSAKSSKSGKVPVLRMGNLQNGSIDLNNLVYTNNNDEISKYTLRSGDLLFNRTNSRELVGKTAIFNGEDAIYAGYLVRFHMADKIDAYFTNYVMNSTYHRNWCNTVKADALGQSNINATKLRNYVLPLIPIKEQNAIVERVDKLMAMIDELEKQVSEREEQSEMLMQSVLQEAFVKE